MKINPIGIQTYQQTVRREQQAPLQTNTDKAAPLKPMLDIPAKDAASRSSLAVKAPSGNYAQFLTTEEKTALDILFSRFASKERFGAGFNTDTEAESQSSQLGRLIDVKV